MAAFFDPGTGLRVPLIEDHILSILGDGTQSDIEDLEDDDQEIQPHVLDDLANEPEDDSSDEELLAPPTSSAATATLSRDVPEEDSLNHESFAPPISRAAVVQSRATARSRGTARSRIVARSRGMARSRIVARSRGTARSRATQQLAGSGDDVHQNQVPSRERTWKQIQFCDKPHDYTELPRKTVRSPIEYYRDYFDENFYEELARCTHLYYLRNTGKELKTTSAEIAKIFGLHIIMGCIPYPRIPMYWRSGTKLGLICDKMTRDRFLAIRNALHVVDHDTPSETEKTNQLWKVQPMITKVRNTCNLLERIPSYYSIDEQMIPFSGRCGLRQVVKNKPRPVGLKKIVLTTSEGLMLDFAIYQGAKTMFSETSLGLGPSVILHLIKTVPPGSCVYHDRYFTTIPLIEEMNKRKLHSTGTIMHNRIPDRAALKFKKDSAMVRGESTQYVREPAVVVKWKDNKSVLMASNCTGSTTCTTVTRWDKQNKCYIDVPAPKVIQSYNQHMGGVDILDQQMEYYRTFIKTKKWTLKVLIHFLDLSLVNSWRLYKNDCQANSYARKNILPLLDFRLNVADALTDFPDRKRRRASDSESSEIEQPLLKKQYRPKRPSEGKRYDGYDHMPFFDDIKAPRSCMFEQCSSRSKIKCGKCDVYLCVSRINNCFTSYHKKN